MRILFWVVIILLSTGCAPKDTETSKVTHSEDAPVISVTLQAREDGLWQVDYTFPAPQKIVIFSRSENEYRAKTWKSLTSNVQLERIGGIDALVFKTPAKTASFKIKPFTGKVRRDYTPFIPFSDGGMAVYTGQFNVLYAQDREDIVSLKGNIRNWHGEQKLHTVKILSNMPMINDGNVERGEALDPTVGTGEGRYIYVGQAEITQGQDFSGVVDPGLPQWLTERFDEDLIKIFGGYADLWGEGLPTKSTILFASRGFEATGFSMKGSALGNMLALQASGQSLRKPSASILQTLHWFFAHEIAHLFQAKNKMQLDNLDHAWVNEGAANTMTNHVLRHQCLANQAYINAQYHKEFEECTQYLQTGKLTEAAKNGQYNIPYTCGDIIGQITDGALKDHTIFDFWNVMLAGAQDEATYSVDDYFATMEKLGASKSIIDRLKKLTHEKVENPEGLLSSLMQDSGLAPKFDTAGQLISLKLP